LTERCAPNLGRRGTVVDVVLDEAETRAFDVTGLIVFPRTTVPSGVTGGDMDNVS
jgi:hypothetical protein